MRKCVGRSGDWRERPRAWAALRRLRFIGLPLSSVEKKFVKPFQCEGKVNDIKSINQSWMGPQMKFCGSLKKEEKTQGWGVQTFVEGG